MDRNDSFGVALEGLLVNSDGWLPSSSGERALARLRESEKTPEVWKMLEKRKPPNLTSSFHRDILRSIIKSFDLVEGDVSPRSLDRIHKEFKVINQAFDTLIQYYGQQAGVDPSTIKVDEPVQGSSDRRSIWQLRQMQATILIGYDLDVNEAVSHPIISKTRVPADRALNFACCLTFYLQALAGRRAYLDFAVAVAAILYEGATVETRTLQNHRSRRKQEYLDALEGSDSLVPLRQIYAKW